MFWTDFAKSIRAEYDKDPKNHLRQKNFTKAYSGKVQPHLRNAVIRDPYAEQVADPDIGGIKKDGKLSQSTMRSILYIREMEKYFDPHSIEWLTDFGPGYGNHIRVWNTLFKTKYYECIDLPELHDITMDYLGKCGIHANFTTYQYPRKPIGKSMFYAAHSLSETVMEIRDKVEEYLPLYDVIYISYNETFEGINNPEYFASLAERLPHETHTYFCKVTGKHRLVGIL